MIVASIDATTTRIGKAVVPNPSEAMWNYTTATTIVGAVTA